MRVVTEPVQAWGKRPSIKLEANSTTTGGSQVQGHKGYNTPHTDTRPQRLQRATNGYKATKAITRHKGNKATKATTPQRRQGHEGNNTTKVNKPSRVPRTLEGTHTRPKPRREPKPMHLMQWLRTPLRCPSPSLPNSNKATKAIGGIREEEQIGGGTPNYSKI